MPRKAAPKPVELDRSRAPVALALMLFVGISLTIGAVLWGRSDSGVIDVSATIANSQYVADVVAGGGTPNAAPAQEYVDLPNGGLQAQGGNVVTPPAPELPPEDTGSSTATTTEDGTESESTESDTADNTETTETDAPAPEETTTESESAQPETSPETDTAAPAGG